MEEAPESQGHEEHVVQHPTTIRQSAFIPTCEEDRRPSGLASTSVPFYNMEHVLLDGGWRIWGFGWSQLIVFMGHSYG